MTATMHIAFAADRNYAEQIITLIKSICFFDKDIHFYLINKDFSEQWFYSLNLELNKINCYITDIKVEQVNFSHLKTMQYVSEASYYRCLIPQLIPQDKVLYLDCDIIANGSLLSLYQQDLTNYLAAASPDFLINSGFFYHKFFPYIEQYFNAGVLLFNNKVWRETIDIEQKLENAIQLYQQSGSDLADQDILNLALQNQCFRLDKKYNYQFGAGYYLIENNRLDIYDEIMNIGNQPPILIHYTGLAKPWTPICRNQYHAEQQYWKAYRLTWAEIIDHHINK
ncbi:glycosyltransferase family 8 protein [Actinobacillus equuli subsp. haemolyticus]|nr:glycosyltransferase family 8 protein [Actinobacillus equuli subsp. haemolyticus]WGE87284.1 glycosyltransferase family 8 protein [Actinobacillus equuli subsp. haemolyticus]